MQLRGCAGGEKTSPTDAWRTLSTEDPNRLLTRWISTLLSELLCLYVLQVLGLYIQFPDGVGRGMQSQAKIKWKMTGFYFICWSDKWMLFGKDSRWKGLALVGWHRWPHKGKSLQKSMFWKGKVIFPPHLTLGFCPWCLFLRNWHTYNIDINELHQNFKK